MPPREDAPESSTWPLAAGIVALILVPYTTISLPFRTGLTAQAAGIALLLVLLLTRGWLCGVRPWRALAPTAAEPKGLLLYLGAALLGTVVGLARGSDPSLLAGQLASLAFLPAGALAAASVAPAERWRSVRDALAGGVALACSFHLVSWLRSASAGEAVHRLHAPNAISPGGLALLGLAMALAVAASGGRPARWGWLAAALICLFVVGSGTRGLWLTALPLILIFGGLSGAWRRVSRRGWFLLLLALGAASILAHLTSTWLNRPRPNLLPATVEDLLASPLAGRAPQLRRSAHLPSFAEWSAAPRPVVLWGPAPFSGDEGAYRLRAILRGHGEGVGALTVLGLDEREVPVSVITLYVQAPTGWQERSIVGFLAPNVRYLRLEVSSQGEGGPWALRALHLERLGPAALTTPLAQLSYLDRRLGTVLAFLPGHEAPPRDTSVSFRLAESRTLWAALVAAEWGPRVFGHGLGATFRFAPPAPGSGPPALVPTNYIHNFYLFLLFKLGIVGALAVAAALCLWVGSAWRGALTAEPGERRAFLAAAAAAWAAYLVLALSSPEIINFRVSALLGLLLAATAGSRERPASPPAPDRR